MEISRRTALIGSSLLGLVGVPTIGAAAPVDPVDRNLEILLANVRTQLGYVSWQVSWIPTMELVTRDSFSRLLLNKLIPVQAMTGPIIQINDQTVAAKTRSLATVYKFKKIDVSYPVVADVQVQLGLRRSIAAIELAAEIDNAFINVMQSKGTAGPMVSSSGIPDAIQQAARKMRPAGDWAVVNRDQYRRLQHTMGLAAENNDPIHIDDVTVHCNHNALTADNLIVIGSYHGGVIYAPYAYAIPTLIIDPETFTPLCKFLTRYGLLGSYEDMAKQFTVLEPDWDYRV